MRLVGALVEVKLSVGTTAGASPSLARRSLIWLSKKALDCVLVSVGSVEMIGPWVVLKTGAPDNPVVASVAVKSMRGRVWFLKYWMSISLMSRSRRRRQSSGRLARASVSASLRLMGAASNDGSSVGINCADHTGDCGSRRINCLSVF